MEQLKEAGFSGEQLEQAGFAVAQVEDAFLTPLAKTVDMSMQQLRTAKTLDFSDKGLYTARNIDEELAVLLRTNEGLAELKCAPITAHRNPQKPDSPSTP